MDDTIRRIEEEISHITEPLFVEWADSDDEHRALGWTAAPSWGVYAEGYKRAADVMVDHVLERTFAVGFVVYPIAFLYRQAVELQIKLVVLNAASLAGWSRDETAEQITSHRVMPLWELAKRAAVDAGLDIREANGHEHLDARIEELENMDPGFEFRYPVDNRLENPTLGGVNWVNLAHLKRGVQALWHPLDNMASELENRLDVRAEYESENHP